VVTAAALPPESRPAARVVFAPDSFKGSASADAAAAALADGWASERPDDELVQRPMADGGEGTVDAFAAAVPGSVRVPVMVDGPDGRSVHTEWLRLPDGTAVVELASASGITLLDPLLPCDAHTRGFGQAIAAALDAGADRLVLAIGGSSSTDGGVGALEALGARFQKADGQPVAAGNAGLRELSSIDLSSLRPVPTRGVTVLCDVTNPLLGSLGAAAVFGPQKGASPDQVVELEEGLAALAGLVSATTGTDATFPGAGAAGGTGYGLLAWGAELAPGSSAVAEVIGLREAVQAADAVITGEGSFDEQSAAGKVPSHVLDAAAGSSCRPLLVAGRIQAPTDAFAATRSLTELAGSSEAAQSDALRWLRAAGAALAEEFGGITP
jgi:glycerate kinase